jgi:hypothetical protein
VRAGTPNQTQVHRAESDADRTRGLGGRTGAFRESKGNIQMSDKSTTRLIAPYLEEATAPLFLSSFFQTPQQNFFNSEKVEYDVMRDGEDIAVPIPDTSTDPREIEANKFTNKAVVPPVFDLAGAVAAFETSHRQPGDTPFDNPDFMAHAIAQSMLIGRKAENMIRRSIELECAQVFQTGKISLKDDAGVERFACDFSMKSGHKITTTAWAADGSTGDPLGDLNTAATVVRQDGKRVADVALFGAVAMQRFLANAKVKQVLFNNFTSKEYGGLTPSLKGEDATFIGWVWVGAYRIEIWQYTGFYKDPQSGTLTPYIDDNKVVVMSSKARRDLCFGYLPLIVPPDARAAKFMPPRIQSQSLGLDLSVNAWITPNNKHVKVSFGTRPLAIPTAIDCHAALTVY